jgi:hypothetical protein
MLPGPERLADRRAKAVKSAHKSRKNNPRKKINQEKVPEKIRETSTGFGSESKNAGRKSK